MSKTYKRSIFIIYPKFQFKFSLMICFIIVLISSIFPIIIYSFFEVISNLSPQISNEINLLKNQSLKIILLWQLGFGIIIFIICILFTHKIAGPMFKLKNYLREFHNGETKDKLFFRKGDYFHDIADAINKTFEALIDDNKENETYFEEISTYLKNLQGIVPNDKENLIKEIIVTLNKIKNKNSLLQG